MTTKNSPLSVLQAQANNIASAIKSAERGDKIDVMFAEKVKAARATDGIKIAVVMDDKVIIVHMPWTVIQATSEEGLAAYILNEMRESRDALN